MSVHATPVGDEPPVPDLPVCQHTSFLTAWYVSTAVWYLLAALWLGLGLWPTRRRAGALLGSVGVLGLGVMVHVGFKQTFHCVLVDASGHELPGRHEPFENPRAFPSLEGALLAYLAVAWILPHRQAWLPALAQRGLVTGVLFSVALSLLWFHTPLQVAISLVLGALVGVAWQRLVVEPVLVRLPPPVRISSTGSIV